jgi:rapamycin-insensitive companion of mTOR
MGPASAIPGAFSTDLKNSTFPRAGTPRPDTAMSRMQSATSIRDDDTSSSEQRQALYRDKIAKELKIKLGTENMLEALLAKSSKQTKDQRQRVEAELGSSNRKIAELRLLLDQEIQRVQAPSTPPSKRMSSYFRGSPLKSTSTNNIHEAEEQSGSTPFEGESPTVVLTETLQALEVEGMTPDYYIDRANTLVELFKLNPTLKYDLAWSVFSLRVQVMLLSDSTDVVAAGYRLTRYAIADRTSLQTIRRLHTDELVILSLVKKTKAVLEREQAVKFVRAFLDVPDGVREISRAVCRTIVAVAEHHDDRLKNICVLTLAEILMKHPSLLISANGISTLSDALAEGSFPASESLIASFLHILDVPRRRQCLKSGREFEAMFAPFTDPLILGGNEERLKICTKAISAMLKSWPGFMTLSMHGAAPLKSLLDSLQYPIPHSRDLVLELLFDVLRIKPPSWSNTFLAGRRLTTYGRVTNLVTEPTAKRTVSEGDRTGQDLDLISHFVSIVLATFVKVGLIRALSELITCEEDPALKRKATLLLTEVLKLAGQSLPVSLSSNLQVLGSLISPLSDMETDDHALNTSLVYQIASINRTVGRSDASGKQVVHTELLVGMQASESSKYNAGMDAEQFRLAMLETGVPNHTQYIKWKWDLIHSLIEGPLTNPKRLEEAIKTTKFLKRVVGFYRPFKYRFCMIRNTRPNQRYVRTGCALIKSLASTSLGIQYLAENKLLRQIAECLAQVDRQSGLTSATPLFDSHQMAETLSGGYFAMIGSLSYTAKGLHLMERWHMMNMFYHIIELRDRDDLIRALLCNMDFSLDSHLRVMLSRSLTTASKDIRLLSTRLLRRYALGNEQSRASVTSAQWALRLLLTQLYDPEVDVCEVAIKMLEEACNQRNHLEFVVKCRPSLDHLGEIGAPLLLRFLSTSVGYHYLHGLDYITQEMDDWFLGRNDAYVTLVEASLAKAYIDPSAQKGNTYAEEPVDMFEAGVLPAHFYRELARTQEGCRLLRQSGHFYEFTSIIQDFDLAEEDFEALTKVKGCLWAVGNVGSMELGAPFLDESEIVTAIIRIAEGAEVISMRGTAFFALGLISRSTHGFEMLLENDWDSAVDDRGQSLGLCMPTDLGRLCAMKFANTPANPLLTADQAEKYHKAVEDPIPLNAKILKLIVDMGNSVMYKKAANDLHAIKNKHGEAFKQVNLFERTLTILESHHFRLLPRQFILDLFDKAVLRHIVLEDDLEDSAEESAGSDTN